MKTRRFYQFGPFRLFPEEFLLTRDGEPVYLKPKVFETLLVLIENRGRILDKETLMQKLWQDSFVEEANLTVNISQLRKALGQSESGERFIDTVPRRGYRFTADVQEVSGDEIVTVINEYTLSRISIEEEQPANETDLLPSGHLIAGGRLKRKTTFRAIVIAVAATLIIGAVGLWFYWRATNMRWATAAIAQIEDLVQEEKYFDAYDLAIEVKKYAPNQPSLLRLLPLVSDDLTVLSEPAGANVYLTRVNMDQSGQSRKRELVGATPLNHLEIARGDYILDIEKDGFAALHRTLSSALDRVERSSLGPATLRREVKMVARKSGELEIRFDADAPIRIHAKLIPLAESPGRMVFVPGGEYTLVGYGKPTGTTVRLDDFFIDQFEVTNSEYKEFVSAGGYLKQQFWKFPFQKEGKEVSWPEAMESFKDRTGLNGPRSWSNQTFPEGKDQHPVTDITWYEAAAYAEFRGKKLPTIFQWEKAARNGSFTHTHWSVMPWGLSTTSDRLITRANFLTHGTVPVDSFPSGMSSYGCYNMAGNVAEWCLNSRGTGFTVAGGSWKDPFYIFSEFAAYPSFHSTDSTGFRCVINSSHQSGDQGDIALSPTEDIPVYRATSRTEAQALVRHYQYDKTPLEARIEDVQQTDLWQREKISYAGAGGERAFAYLYLPKNTQTPVQVIHYVPTDAAYYGWTLPDEIEAHAAPYIKAGRAVFAVALKGYKERPWPPDHEMPKRDSVAFRDLVINWAIDHHRGLDYLVTRNEVDTGKIACFAVSVNNRKLALIGSEARYAAVILMGAGLIRSWADMIAEANGVNFLPHILAPKLMINGRYDEAMSFRAEAEPLYRLLRAPKELVVVDQGHVPSLEVSVPTINRWLDQTLGLVKR